MRCILCLLKSQNNLRMLRVGGLAAALFVATGVADGAAFCSATSGALTLKASAVRDTGISPFLVFFDATDTTDSSIGGSATPFQRVFYTWNFGDAGAYGTGTWSYG